MVNRLLSASLFVLAFLFGAVSGASSRATAAMPYDGQAVPRAAADGMLTFPYVWNPDNCTEYFQANGVGSLGGWNFKDGFYSIGGKGTNWRGSVSSEPFDIQAGTQVKLSFDYATENEITLSVKAVSADGEQVIYDATPDISPSLRTLTMPFTASGPTAILITAKMQSIMSYGSLMITNINFTADVADLACERITSPSVGSIALGTATEVKAVFRNVSGWDIASPVFCYSYGAKTVRESYDGVVAAGESVEYAFAEPLQADEASAGELKVWLESEADANDANDAVSAVVSFYEPVEFPYVNNFNGDDPFKNWAVMDANGDGVTWTGGAISEGDAVLVYPKSTTTAADYAFLPAINMPSGQSRLTFYYASQYGRECHLNVLMGTSPDVSKMERLLDFDFANRGWLAAYKLLDVPTDGTYYFAFECTKGGDVILIDNLYIDRDNDLCMNGITFDTRSGFNKTDTRVTLSYINHGVDPQSGIEVKYYVNSEPADSAVVTDAVMPGDTLYYTFEAPCDISAPDSTYTLIGEIKTPVGPDVQNDRIMGASLTHFANQKLPYSFGFEDASRCMQWANSTLSGTNAWFAASTFQSYNGSNVLAHNGNESGQPAADWTFSECIEIPAGRYELSFFYRTKMHWDGPDYEQSFKVMIGNDATHEAMTIPVADFEKVAVKGYAYSKFNTVVEIPEDGLYYIGFYNYSADNRGETYIDDLQLQPLGEGLPLPYTTDFTAGADGWTLYNPRNHNWAYDEESGAMLMDRSDYYATIEGTEGLMVSPKLRIGVNTKAKVTFEYCAFVASEGDSIDVALYGGTVNNPADMQILEVYSPSADYATATYTIEAGDEPLDYYFGLRSSLFVQDGAYTIRIKSFRVEAEDPVSGIAEAGGNVDVALNAVPGSITVSSPTGITGISVYSLSGKLVTRIAANSTTVTFGCGTISGVHLVRIETPSGVVIRKIVM